MGSGNSLRGGRLLVAAFVVLAPATAMAHAYVMQPPSRDAAEPDLNARAKKTGPCGGSPRVGKPTQYEAGATVQVKWEETIDHQGCFQIAFSPANDKDWVTLKQIPDPTNNLGVHTDTVKLPAGVTCKDCTLVVRQLMLENLAVKTCTPDAAPPASTYYSCADIRVGDFPDAGETQPPADGDDDAGASSSGGPTPVPTDDAGKTNTGSSGSGAGPGTRKVTPVDAGDGGGCSIALGATSGFSLFASAGLGLLALSRRRRRSG